METILDYIKNNLLSIIAILISLFALYQNSKSDKSKIQREIAKKEAELKVLKSTNHFSDGTTMNDAMIRISVLDREITVLKSLLE